MDEHPHDATGHTTTGHTTTGHATTGHTTTDHATGTAPDAPVDAEARKWAMVAHLSSLVGLLGNGVGFLLGPLVVWAIKKDDHPFIDRHGKEAINFQLSVIIAGLIGVALVFTIIGILVAVPLLIVVAVMAVVFPIVAAVRINEGEDYRYPITWRFIE